MCHGWIRLHVSRMDPPACITDFIRGYSRLRASRETPCSSYTVNPAQAGARSRAYSASLWHGRRITEPKFKEKEMTRSIRSHADLPKQSGRRFARRLALPAALATAAAMVVMTHTASAGIVPTV